MSEPVIALNKLTKSYGKHRGIEEISFTVERGEIFGFIGPNGAGKSTTIRTLMGLLKPTGGTASVFGLDCGRQASEIAKDVGYLPSENCYYNSMKVKEMLLYTAELYGVAGHDRMEALAERLHLDLSRRIGDLSLGNKKKVGIVSALLPSPKLLIMDEPTSGLDPLFRSQLLDLLRDYMEKGGKGVFFSTHITSDLDKIADMLIMIDQGHIVFREDKDELLDRYRIVKGSKEDLNEEVRSLLFHIQETAFGFTGMTSHISQIQKLLPNVLLERPTVEDIMLSHTKGGMKNAAEFS